MYSTEFELSGEVGQHGAERRGLRKLACVRFSAS